MGSKRALEEEVGMAHLSEKDAIARTLEDKLHDAIEDEDARLSAKVGSDSCFQVLNTMMAENKEK